MNTLTQNEFLKDLELVDQTGRADRYVVYWRKVPVGFIELFKRQPPPNSPEKLRKIFREAKGKWYNAWSRSKFCEQKEDAALELIQSYFEKNGETEIAKAMLHKDFNFIEEWLKRIAANQKVEIE